MKITFAQNTYNKYNQSTFKALNSDIVKNLATNLKPPKVNPISSNINFSNLRLKLEDNFAKLINATNTTLLPLTIHLTKIFSNDLEKIKEKVNTYKKDFLHPTIQIERLNRLNKKTLDTNTYLQIIELLDIAYNLNEYDEEIDKILDSNDRLDSKIADLSSKLFEKYTQRSLNISRIPYHMREDYSAFVKDISKHLKENCENIDPLMLKSLIYNIEPHNKDIVKHLCSKDSCIKNLKTRQIICTLFREDVSCAGYLNFLQNKKVYTLDNTFIINLTKAYYDALRYCNTEEKNEILGKVIDLYNKIKSNPEDYIYNNSTSSINVLFEYCVNELAKMYYVYDDKTIDELFSKRLDNVISFLDTFRATPRNLDLIKDLATCKGIDGKNFTSTEKLNFARIVSVMGDTELRQLEEMSFDGIVDLEKLKKDYFHKIFHSVCISQNEINSIKDDKYNLWDITYLPMIAQSKNGNTDGFSEFFKASFLGEYMDYIHNSEKEVGMVNLKTKQIFEDRGINYEKWLNPPKENEVNLKIINKNKEKLNHCVEDLVENINEIRKSPIKKFFDRRYSEYIKDDKFELPKAISGSKENLENFVKNLLVQLEPAWKRAQNNLKKTAKASILEQAGKTLTLKDHFESILKDLSEFKDNDLNKNLDLKIKLWDRIPEKDLFQGNYSTCCIALDRVNGKAMPDYLLSTSINMIEIVDNQSGNTIGNALCFLAVDENNKTCFIIDNIEINNNYRISDETGTKILNAIKTYINNYCKSFSKEDLPIYMGKFFNDIKTKGANISKTIEFLGKVNTSNLYLDTFGSWTRANKLKKEVNVCEL